MRVGGRTSRRHGTGNERAYPGGQCDGETLLAVSRTRGTWGGRKAATVGVGGCGSAKGGRCGDEVLLLLQRTASSGSSRFWANEQTAGRKFVGAAVSSLNGRGRIRTRGGSSGQSATRRTGRRRRGSAGKHGGAGAGVRVRVRVQADNLDRPEVEITPALVGVRIAEVVGVDSYLWCLVFGLSLPSCR